MSWFNLILSFIYFGIGLFTVFTAMFSLLKEENINRLNAIIKPISFQLIKWIGIIFILFSLTFIFLDVGKIQDRLSGNYSFVLIVPIVVYGLLPQLFWIKFVKDSVIIQIVLGIIFVSLSNIERFVIIVTSIHQDYLQSSWSSYAFFKSIFIEGLIALSLYSFLIFMVFLIQTKINKSKG